MMCEAPHDVRARTARARHPESHGPDTDHDTALCWATATEHAVLVEAAERIGCDLVGEHLRRLQLDLQVQHALVARQGDDLVGFVSFFLSDGAAYLSWVVVADSAHGEAVRSLLFERLARDLARLGVGELRSDVTTPAQASAA